MYNDFVKDKENKPKVYEMPMKSYANGMKGFLKALKSWSVGLVYGLLLITIVISFFVIIPKTKNHNASQIIEEDYIKNNSTTKEVEPVFKPAD